ncbi:MAG: WYL domain-containing protein [Clostridium sp.]
MECKASKVERVLWIYNKLIKSACINKKDVAVKFGVDERSIQRDISDVNAYLSNYIGETGGAEVAYKRKRKGYHLVSSDKQCLTREDVLAISRILLESRAFMKDDMYNLIDGLMTCIEANDVRDIKRLIGDELLNYTSVRHSCDVISSIWEYTECIKGSQEIEIEYKRSDEMLVSRVLHPASIIFSEYYFYLIAYQPERGYDFPTIYRIDRIQSMRKTGEKSLAEDYGYKVTDTELRRKVPFMYGGKLNKIRLEYTGTCPDIVLDKMPTGQIIKSKGDTHIIEAEVYGKGIIMWILSQGSNLKLLYPSELVEDIKKEIYKMQNMYN